mmetsp:Transcript_25017/g.41835  ORF Transcript_25017/g.41835 Transcript_25017/m.41835 type:complete len:107 (-) Transcript_25017:1261-1581(-)
MMATTASAFYPVRKRVGTSTGAADVNRRNGGAAILPPVRVGFLLVHGGSICSSIVGIVCIKVVLQHSPCTSDHQRSAASLLVSHNSSSSSSISSSNSGGGGSGSDV